tara:strand:+ start:133491 stop:133607 length:117 start_codon:yes stop_codon:yes gene_type:complete
MTTADNALKAFAKHAATAVSKAANVLSLINAQNFNIHP